jgi:hypothetical protein
MVSLLSPFGYIQAYPDRTKEILGITHDQFEELVFFAEQAHRQRQEEIENSKVRVHAKGGGRKKELSNAEEICLCLFYLRQSPVFIVLGMLFGISKTAANDAFHYWLNILENLLPSSLMEQAKQQEIDMELLQEFLVKHRLLVDSTEQARERPGDNKEQKRFYSGKKKNHTFKNQIISLPEGKDIVDVIVGERGPASDITLFREQKGKFSERQEYDGDKAYVGEEQVTTPHKKPPKGELTEKQKEENKLLSSKRIFIEHLNRLLKIFRVAKERFRLGPKIYTKVICTVCGLVRLRIGALNLSDPGLSNFISSPMLGIS